MIKNQSLCILLVNYQGFSLKCEIVNVCVCVCVFLYMYDSENSAVLFCCSLEIPYHEIYDDPQISIKVIHVYLGYICTLFYNIVICLMH